MDNVYSLDILQNLAEHIELIDRIYFYRQEIYNQGCSPYHSFARSHHFLQLSLSAEVDIDDSMQSTDFASGIRTSLTSPLLHSLHTLSSPFTPCHLPTSIWKATITPYLFAWAVWLPFSLVILMMHGILFSSTSTPGPVHQMDALWHSCLQCGYIL